VCVVEPGLKCTLDFECMGNLRERKLRQDESTLTIRLFHADELLSLSFELLQFLFPRLPSSTVFLEQTC
jgi:hypothetical protein